MGLTGAGGNIGAGGGDHRSRWGGAASARRFLPLGDHAAREIAKQCRLFDDRLAPFATYFRISMRVAAIAGGVRVFDVWESREAFDSFIETRVHPVLPESDITGPNLSNDVVKTALPG